MAAPVTHLYFADKFCDKHWEIDRFQFFAWNCLPDIRYVDKTIKRTKYHVKNLTMTDIFEETSDFWKWVKFHSFIDENRDAFYQKHNIYIPKVSDEKFIKSLKFLEDDILYWKLSFRHDFIKFLSEYEFPVHDINLKSVNEWKKLLSDYFSIQPCEDSRNKFFRWIGATEDLCIKIETLLSELRCEHLQEVSDMIVVVENNIK